MPYVHVDLNELDTDDLIDEIKNRWLSDDEKKRLLDYLATDECAKMSYLLSVYDKYSLMELKEIFKEDLTVSAIPKEQLALSL